MGVASSPGLSSITSATKVWKLRWLTPAVCRLLFVLLLAFGFFSHLHYLINDCPIDLAGDEAQYWDWSRNLDLSYYSKGPLVAYIIRSSTAIFGNSMPAVRLPALVLGVMTSIVTYLLARKLFRSDRVALGTVLLYHLVPLFVAGSVLMTIDPPFFFCWALATYLLSFAIFDNKKWAWIAIGVVAGVGFLAKYAMFLWFIPMLIALAADPVARRWLRTRWPWVAVGIATLFTTQVVIWNARHDWVSFQHVTTQTGASGGKFSFANLLELFGGQAGLLGPGMTVIIIGSIVYAFRTRGPKRDRAGFEVSSASRGRSEAQPRANDEPAGEAEDPGFRFAAPAAWETDSASAPPVRQMRFLAIFGITFFAFTVFTAFRAKVQMNWPAPSYFTLMILATYFLSTRLQSVQTWKPWRPWFYFTIVFGLIMLPIAHNPEWLYPGIRWTNENLVPLKQPWEQQGGWRKTVARVLPKEPLDAQQIDFTYKLKGWREAGALLSQELKGMGDGAFALCHDYQQSAALAFYLEGQPNTFYAASYYHEEPGRMTQYDVWPDRQLGPDSPLVGKNAIFLGRHDAPFPDLLAAFERVEGVTTTKPKLIDGKWVETPVQRALKLEVIRGGLDLRTFRYFRCYGFKGMTRLPQDQLSK